MKIAVVIKHYSATKGGGERYAFNLIRALAKKGHKIHIFAASFDGEVPPNCVKHFVKMPRKPSWLKVLSFAYLVRKKLEGMQFDIVYGLTQVYPVDVYRVGGGVYKHWLQIQYPDPFHKKMSIFVKPIHIANLFLEKKILNNSNYKQIIVNSNLCKSHLIKYYEIPNEKIKVVYNGVDHNKFSPDKNGIARKNIRLNLGLKPSTFIILFVSNNWKRKGLFEVISALGKLNKQINHFHLLVIGRGKPSKFRQKIKELKLDGNISFVGFVKEIVDFYRAADILVLPTMYDPFSNVCLEAMACGVPVITSSSNGASEIIQNGVNGFVLDNIGDIDQLSWMLRQCQDENRLKQMSIMAREISLHYDIDSNTQDTLRIFQEIFQNKSKKERLSLQYKKILDV